MAEQVALFADGELAEAPSPLVAEAQAIWNEYATKNKWKKCVVLDKARRAAMSRAIQDYGGLVGWRAALQKVERNRFVMGKIPPRDGLKQFVANIDWFCRAVTIRKVFEDFYEDDGGQNGVQSFGDRLRAAAPVDWDARLGRYRPGGFWHVATEGPRPEDMGEHKAPADKIAAWRAKHGLGERKRETREERLAGMITSYRRVGKYADANRLEEELAKLEGRPPVLVPAPDAKDPDVVPETRSYSVPPYRPAARPSEAEITRAMAAKQAATDVDYSWATDREGEYEDGTYDSE